MLDCACSRDNGTVLEGYASLDVPGVGVGLPKAASLQLSNSSTLVGVIMSVRILRQSFIPSSSNGIHGRFPACVSCHSSSEYQC